MESQLGRFASKWVSSAHVQPLMRESLLPLEPRISLNWSLGAFESTYRVDRREDKINDEGEWRREDATYASIGYGYPYILRQRLIFRFITSGAGQLAINKTMLNQNKLFIWKSSISWYSSSATYTTSLKHFDQASTKALCKHPIK